MTSDFLFMMIFEFDNVFSSMWRKNHSWALVTCKRYEEINGMKNFHFMLVS